MKVTVRKIAAQAGVSPATISRYFNGTQKLTKETIDKIEETMKDMGYVPKAKKKKTSNLIGVLLPHLRYGFYCDAFRELMEQAESLQYKLVLIPADQNGSYNYKEVIDKNNFKGVIYFEEEIENDILDYISQLGIKTVMCGGAALDHNSNMVHVNDMAAAYEGTKYLIKLGHKDIVFISDNIQKISAGFQRLTGSRRAMEEYGLSFEEEAISYGPVTYEAGYEATKKFIEKGRPFTAIFAYSDEIAIGAMAALYDAGIRVPEDVSILGFDDLQIASRIRPALTTIHQPINSFITKTLELFSQETNNYNAEISLPFQIIERDSCKGLDKSSLV
jgi:LacI family transcriptional regulator/LacI family repressor for deo operon, udp, cdd, tsx, nupC, and nupG